MKLPQKQAWLMHCCKSHDVRPAVCQLCRHAQWGATCVTKPAMSARGGRARGLSGRQMGVLRIWSAADACLCVGM